MRADPLIRALRLLQLPTGRTVFAVFAAAAAAASALTLAGLSAWLIARAWQMPPVLDLSVAVVAVRAFGISRGVFRYVERLAAHDLALRGMATVREASYARLAGGNLGAVISLKRGDLLTRTGADVDAVGAVVVRALVPIAVAVLLAPATVTALALISPAAGVVAAIAMLLAGVVAPWAGARRAAAAEHDAMRDDAGAATYTVSAVEHAAELRVAGRLSEITAQAHTAAAHSAQAADRAAASSASAAAAAPLATGLTTFAALVIGIAACPVATEPTTFVVLVLLPLAAFEVIAMLPAAAAALTRGRFAAGRLLALLDQAGGAEISGTQQVPAGATLESHGSAGLMLPPGARAVITGRSGTGKTTLLRALAGLHSAPDLRVTLNGTDISQFDQDELRRAVTFFAEDSHIFATTVLENLRVAKGSLSPQQAHAALAKAGLAQWLATLPEGLDTVLAGGENALSGGQRRRLLLARALVSPARVLLLDEPTEHLEAAAGADIIRALLDRDSGMVSADRTVVVVTHQLPPEHQADRVLELGPHAKELLPHLSWSSPVLPLKGLPESAGRSEPAVKSDLVQIDGQRG